MAVSAILLVLTFSWLAWEIPKGVLVATDELLTAERTREMQFTGEKLVVQVNFQPSFEKPPLQYWLSTLTLDRFGNRSAAIRIWTLIFGALTALVLAWLVFLVEPSRPWLIPLSLGILLSCPMFSTQATRGLLDIGLAFFTILTLAFAELARKETRWWIAVALACWLGCLEKVPFPFLIWILILLIRASSPTDRGSLRTKWLPISLALSLVLMSLWPLLQLLKYHMPLGPLLRQELITWPAHRLGSKPFYEVAVSMSGNAGACGFLALIAPIAIVCSKRGQVSQTTRQMALISLLILLGVSLSIFRQVRYVIPIIPLLCFLIGLMFYLILERGGWMRRIAIPALLVVIVAGLVETKIQINHLEGKNDQNDPINRLLPFVKAPRDVTDEKMIAERLGNMQRPGVKIVLVESANPGTDLLWNTFYLFHGNLRSPVTSYTPDQFRDQLPSPPMIGVCVARDFPLVQQSYPQVRSELVRDQFVCWQVPATDAAESSSIR